MAPGDEYSAVGGGGKLKLKGMTKVKDGRVEKKKKKKDKEKEKDKVSSSEDRTEDRKEEGSVDDATIAVRHHVDEQQQQQHDEARRSSREGTEERGGLGHPVAYKTEAERRYEEQKRKRLNERLRREGVKTHKERVEELNRYLSNLSEHHDMPKIGPG